MSPQEAAELLQPWFKRGWPIKAVLYGLDQTYQGEKQRYHRKESEAESFERRMAHWIDGFGKLRPTPVEPLDAEAINAGERKRWHTEVGHHRPATSRSEADRRWVRGIADSAYTRARGDRIERARESSKRLRKAMDSLGPGPNLTEPEELFAAEQDSKGALYETITHRAAMRTSGLDQETAASLADAESPGRRVLSNRYRRYRLSQAYAHLDALTEPE